MTWKKHVQNQNKEIQEKDNIIKQFILLIRKQTKNGVTPHNVELHQLANEVENGQ